MIKEIILVALGGAIGSAARYAIKLLFISFNLSSFLSTMTVNVVGSFLIGIIISVVSGKFYELFLVVGLMGGFTTFSSFSLESVSMIQNGEYITGILYITLSFVICLLMTYCGITIGKSL